MAGIVVLWMGAALFRLAYLQLFCYSDYLSRAERQQQRIVEVSPRRGILYDRNFHGVAMSLTMESCYAMPGEITDQDMVARGCLPACWTHRRKTFPRSWRRPRVSYGLRGKFRLKKPRALHR